MAMRETVRSFRAYLILMGALSLAFDVSAVRSLLRAEVLPPTWRLALGMSTLASIALGVGWVWAGVRLPIALRAGAGWVRTLLLLTVADMVAEAIIFGAVLGDAHEKTSVTSSLIGLAISIYLLANLRRLVRDATQHAAPVARAL